MPEHFCQFAVHWPVDQDDKFVRCGKPAGLKRGDKWLCAEHWDYLEAYVYRQGTSPNNL
jgi:hypothetical protein